MSNLPRPVTNQDFYMLAILDELRQIREQLPVQQYNLTVSGSQTVELREPALGTPLPDDFPGYDKLVEAGILFLESVPRDGDTLTAIDGIGKVTAGRILAYLVG